jgi:hypothetical protein
LRRVESDEQVWCDLLAQRADFLVHQTDVDRFAVDELERPGADPQQYGRVVCSAAIDEAEQPDVNERARDVGENSTTNRVMAWRRRR